MSCHGVWLSGRWRYPLVAWFLVWSAFAHVDDPKERDRQPPYRGPGFRALSHKTAAMEFSVQGLTLLSWLPLGEFGGNIRSGIDCWGYVSPSGREYALMALSHGTGFVDITTPEDAGVVAVLAGPASSWRDIKVYKSYAYVVSEGGGGIQVFDLSRIDEGEVTLANRVPGGFQQTHNVAINEDSGFLYRCGGGDNGLRIYSLADPALPVFAAQWTDRYVHDAQVVSYSEGAYAGREIAFCASGFNGGSAETGLSILDVTDKNNIEVLVHYQYPDPSYSHQGWLSEDKRYFYLNDEGDEITTGITSTTHVIDVVDLQNPIHITTFTTGRTSIDHNLFVRENLIFEANYRSGLHVFDATDPLAPKEIAFFDTYPDDDEPRFNGLWGCYPFFPSKVIIGSDVEKGLFVWKLDSLPAISQVNT